MHAAFFLHGIFRTKIQVMTDSLFCQQVKIPLHDSLPQQRLYTDIRGAPRSEAQKQWKGCKKVYIWWHYLWQLTKVFSYLYMHLRVRIHVVKQLLVVDVLLIPLQGFVVAKVVPQGDKEHFAAVEFGLFTVLVQEQLCPDWQTKGERKGGEMRGHISWHPNCPVLHMPVF